MFQEENHINNNKNQEEEGGDNSINEDMWYDIEQFQLDHLNEVLQRLSEGTLDDEIWGKLVIMEKTKRIAKAYLRKTTIIVDGGDEEFDGMTIGFNYFTNEDRDQQTTELRRKIGDGVIIKMDNHGNIKAMARGTAPVIIQNWRSNKKHCIAEKLVRLQGRLITKRCVEMNDDDRIFKVFDMKKFKMSLETDSFDTDDEIKNVLLKSCLRVALVKDGSADDPMETPCWFMLINLVALDMIKTKFPHIADLNCMYGELGTPSVIPSIKRSALREQIESSSSSNRRRSQSYYECLSDANERKYNARNVLNHDNIRRKSNKRNISSSDDSEESNTEGPSRYPLSGINSRFLKPYSGSITDSSSGFASGTDKRSFSSSNKRSTSDLTKSVEDLKINSKEIKKIHNPGFKVPGIRPKLDKNIFEPPQSQHKRNNIGIVRKRSSLQECDRDRRREYRNSCNFEDDYYEERNNLNRMNGRSLIDINNEVYIKESSMIKDEEEEEEGKDFDIGEALKNVDESFNYLETDDYYSDSFSICSIECNNNENIIKKDIDNVSLTSLVDDTYNFSLDRRREARKPVTKNWLQTIDRVRSKASKKFKGGDNEIHFNRSETIKCSNSISIPLEVVNASAQFIKSQDHKNIDISWKEWRCLNDKIYKFIKNSSDTFNVKCNISLSPVKDGKLLNENEYVIPPYHYREYTDASSLANHLQRFNEEQCLDKKIPRSWFKDKRQNILPSKNWIFSHSDNPSPASRYQTLQPAKRIGRAVSVKGRTNQQEKLPRRKSSTIYWHPIEGVQSTQQQSSKSPIHHLQHQTDYQRNQQKSREYQDIYQQTTRNQSFQWKSAAEHLRSAHNDPTVTSPRKTVEMSVKLQVYKDRNNVKRTGIEDFQQPQSKNHQSSQQRQYQSELAKYSQPHVPPTKEPAFTTKSVWTATTVPTASAGDSPVGAIPARANLYGKKPITGYISGHPSTPSTESQKSINSSKNNQRIKSLFKEYESETNRIGEVTQSCKNPQSTNIKEWKEIKYASGDNRTTTEQRTTNLLNITKTSGPNPSLDTKTCQCPTGERNTNEASDTLKSLPSALSDTSSSSGDDLPDPTNATTTKSNIPGQLSTECTSKFYFSREDESKEPGRRTCIFKNTSTRQEETRIDDREPLSGWWKRDMLPKRESCKPERSINSLIGIFEQSIGFPLPSTFKNDSTNVSATNKTNEQSATTSISRTNEKEWDDKDGPTRDTISTTKTRWNDIWKQKAAPKRVLRDSIPTKLSTIYLEENNREEEEIIVKLK